MERKTFRAAALGAPLDELRVDAPPDRAGMIVAPEALVTALRDRARLVGVREIVARERVARRYSAGLADVAIVPKLARGSTSVWAQYTMRLAAGRRDALAAALNPQGIPTAIYYPTPLHCQEPYRRFPVAEGGAPVSERLADEVISLPMHAYLDEATQDRIIAAVRRALGA